MSDRTVMTTARRLLPVVRGHEVFHVGPLDAAGAMAPRWVAVSRCPRVWQGMAGLGDVSLVRLRKPEAVLLDVQKVARSSALRSEIEAWALAQGYAVRQPAWQVRTVDGRGRWKPLLFVMETEARDQARRCGIGEDRVGPASVLVGTALLAARFGVERLDDRMVFDFAAAAWADDEQPQVDGLWWRDAYAPERRMAPGGIVFGGRLGDWALEQVQWQGVSDDTSEEMLVPGFLHLA